MSSQKSKKIVYEPFDWRALSPQPVIGVDEVGRGCLAGPVYAAAVILPEVFSIEGLTDSKKLSASRREELSLAIHEQCEVCIACATVEEIDEINILQASLLAMKRAIEGLEKSKAIVLVDGKQKIPHLNFPQQTLIKGDLRAEPVAAASIVAKVFRDRLMSELGDEYPGYGLGEHKGYATKVHKEAIAQKGPTPIHRQSFAGVKEYIQSPARPLL